MNEELRAELLRRVAADQEAWPPDAGETSTAACPQCGLVLTFRLGD